MSHSAPQGRIGKLLGTGQQVAAVAAAVAAVAVAAAVAAVAAVAAAAVAVAMRQSTKELIISFGSVDTEEVIIQVDRTWYIFTNFLCSTAFYYNSK